MKKIFFVCLFILATASLASAKPYFGLGVQAVFLEDADLEFDEVGLTVTPEAEYETGYGGMIFAGYDFKPLRLEAEVAYRKNDLDDINAAGITITDFVDIDGDATALSFMVNGYLDFDLGGIRPFIGAGAGVAKVELELEFEGESDDEDDDVFAYQGMAGIGIPMEPIILDIGYRFFATEDPDLDGLETEYKSHNVYLAVRF